jgi:hypothetical protein
MTTTVSWVVRPPMSARKYGRGPLTMADMRMIRGDQSVLRELIESGRIDDREADAIERAILLMESVL